MNGKLLSHRLCVLGIAVWIAALTFSPAVVSAGGEEDLFISVAPNVLLIFDNSNSMDEDDAGNAVGSYNTVSRSVIGRKALQEIVNTYVKDMRLGLMTYRLPGVSSYYLHNSPYFVSYEPKSYCPDPPPECQDYCSTGNVASKDVCGNACRLQNPSFDETYMDEIITGSTGAKREKYCRLVYPKTTRLTNPTDVSRYIYYKQALPYYNPSGQGTTFYYATTYSMNESTGPPNAVPGVSYARWRNKTGTADGNSGYTVTAGGNVNFGPTDSDAALGYMNFGRRLFNSQVGRTWFANSSPGGGYLQINCDTNTATNAHRDSLLTKIATKEGDETGYMTCASGSGNTCSHVINAGLTPMAGTLRSAQNYFLGAKDYRSNANNTSPIQDWCQKNFIVYVTDGLPSVGETGTSGSAEALIVGAKQRITELRNLSFKISGTDYPFDVQTYVIGLSLTEDSQQYLNALAVEGGTAVDGKAYYANDLDELKTALFRVFQSIGGKAFSFATASVSASRVKDENYLYEASFLPSPESTQEPFWLGYLRQFTIEEDGDVALSYNWDAGEVLRAADAASRNIWTLKGAAKTAFNTTNMDAVNLDVSTDTHRDLVVNFVRGGELDPNYRYAGWKLGDIFHSSPKTIGTPSADYTDQVDANYPKGYENFRTNTPRTTTAGSGQGKRIVVVGANDGQMHAFRTTDGAEVWSFIPPNLLPNLKNIAHNTHTPIPAGLSHTYFVDGPISASDVWLPSTASAGTSKLATDWYTYMVFALRQGGENTLWSSSSTCESGFSPDYNSSTAPYYCGYYALNITNTLVPDFKWVIGRNTTGGVSSTHGPYFGQPWSRMGIGRLKNNSGHEIWVGFVGGGYSGVEHKPPSVSHTKGKGFFVIDIATGNILWKFTYADDSNMRYDLAGPPAIVDVDNDGFIDTVYAADLGGNLWRFNFCKESERISGACTPSGKRLFASSTGEIRPIFTSPSVAKDKAGNLWVYFGTGDIMNPTDANAQEYFFAIKDNDRTSTWTSSGLENITSGTYDPNSSKKGWYIKLSGSGQKILSDPSVFRGVVYFTAYTPTQSTSLCIKSGTSDLFAVDYVTGAGKFDNDGRSVTIGSGLATSPIVSLNPHGGTDVYASTSSTETGEAHTKKQQTPTIANLNRTNLFFWRDMRVD